MGTDLIYRDENSCSLSNSQLQYSHPLDVLYQINPEIASLAYANRENWLTPEIMPSLARFRECQAEEKIALLDSIVRKSAIDSNERIQMEAQKTLEVITQIEWDGTIEVETIKTVGMVEAQRIEYGSKKEMVQIQAQAALDIQKMKYETDVKILEEHMSGLRYLSDNQLKATCIEAEAMRDAIIFSEKIRSASEDRKTNALLIRDIHKAETEFMTKMYEAELMRQSEHDGCIASITETYILVQAQIMRDSLFAEIETKKAEGAAEKQSLHTISEIARTALNSSDAKKTVVIGESKYGAIKVVVKRSDEE